MKESRPILSLIVIIAACGFGYAETASADQCESLRIINKRYNKELSQVEMDLENVSDRIVTAWRITALSGNAHGGQRIFGLDLDFFQGLRDTKRATVNPGSRMRAANQARGPIYPGEAFPVRWPMPLQYDERGYGFPVIVVLITACIFEDTGWEGNEDYVDGIFAARVARLRDLEDILGFVDGIIPATYLEPRGILSQLEKESSRLKAQAESEPHVLSPYPQAASVASASRLELSQLVASVKETLIAEPGRAAELLKQIRLSLGGEYGLARQNVRLSDLTVTDSQSR